MADGSPLPFPSPSTLLGDSAPTPSPADSSIANRKKDTAHARRPSNDKKKKGTPRKAAAVEVKDASVGKPKQTKSRNGCITCKAKRLKCGEEKPGCQNCAKRNVTCGGYKKVFQWRDYGGQQNGKTTGERPKQAASNTSPILNHASVGSSLTTTPVSEMPPGLSAVSVPTTVQSRSKTPPGVEESQYPLPQQCRARSDSPHKQQTSPHDSAFITPPLENPDPAPPPGEASQPNVSDEFASVSFSPQHMFAYRSRSLSPGFAGNTPTFTEFLLPQHSVENGTHQDFVAFSMPEDMQVPLWSAMGDDGGMNEPGIFDNDLDVIPIERHDTAVFAWPTRMNTPTGSKDCSPSGALAFWNESMPGIYAQPDFPINSPELLVAQFLRSTAGILSVMDGPTENPWRTIVWPMAQHSAALYHAVLAMTAFHSARDDPRFRLYGQEHKALSIQNIHQGISEQSMTDQTAIATALALGFCESWEMLTVTGNCHIKGAQCLVRRVLQRHRKEPIVGAELKRLKFLCNAWVYMDVIARLTSVDSDDTTEFDSIFSFAPDSPRLALPRTGPEKRGFGIDFGMPVDSRLDPLMGCASTLFPIIGRVANLVRKVCRSNHNSPGIVSQGRDLKRLLEEWDPPDEVEVPEDPTTGVQNALQTAEAYRWATLLHLHQAVPELPSLPSEELAQRAMAAVATVPAESRTVIVQIYPLMVAGCEQTAEEDRQWVRERWHAMASRMRIGVLDKCLEVAEEVWRRRGAYEAKPILQRKLVRTAELKEARRHSSPHPLTPTIAPNHKHGSTGMVFSYVETDSEPVAHQLKDVNAPAASMRRRKDGSDQVTVDPAYSVRGPLHWVGVMWDWEWEVLLA